MTPILNVLSSSVSPCDPHLASPRGSGALCATYVANTSISSMLLSRNNSKPKQQIYVRSHVSFSWGKLEKFDEKKTVGPSVIWVCELAFCVSMGVDKSKQTIH